MQLRFCNLFESTCIVFNLYETKNVMKKKLLFAIVLLCLNFAGAQDLIYKMLASGESVRVGTQKEKVSVVNPNDYTIYVVRSGETMYGIAKDQGVDDWMALCQFNGLDAPYIIYPDMKIRIPKKEATTDNVPDEKIPVVEGAIGFRYGIIKKRDD